MHATPRTSPLYPPAPYLYTGLRMAVAMYQIDASAASQLLPPGVEFGGLGACVAVFAEYPESTVGTYNEVVFLVSADYRGTPGFYCPFIYVTTDATLASGREIWGFPKKIADISVIKDGDMIEARLARAGAVAEMRATLVGDADPAMVSALTALPTFNEKFIPSADGTGADVHVLTSTSLELSPTAARVGTGKITLTPGAQDAWDLLVPATGDEVAAFWVEADSVLPAATVAGPLG